MTKNKRKKDSPNGWFISAAFVVLGLGYYLEVFQLVELMWPSGLISIALLFFAHIDKLKKFKIGPVEAELRDEIKKARASIAQVQDLAVTMASTCLSLLYREGRGGGGYSPSAKAAVEKQVLEQLGRLGIKPEDHQRIFEDPIKCTDFDYVQLVSEAIKNECELDATQSSELLKLSDTGIDIKPTASPEALQEFMRQNNCKGNEAKELLEDYRYYKRYRNHRRPEVWQNRGKPPIDLGGIP